MIGPLFPRFLLLLGAGGLLLAPGCMSKELRQALTELSQASVYSYMEFPELVKTSEGVRLAVCFEPGPLLFEAPSSPAARREEEGRASDHPDVLLQDEDGFRAAFLRWQGKEWPLSSAGLVAFQKIFLASVFPDSGNLVDESAFQDLGGDGWWALGLDRFPPEERVSAQARFTGLGVWGLRLHPMLQISFRKGDREAFVTQVSESMEGPLMDARALHLGFLITRAQGCEAWFCDILLDEHPQVRWHRKPQP
ncbi:MAG: hypothetical protein ACE5H3_08095 [Planctomycetota bacterium]